MYSRTLTNIEYCLSLPDAKGDHDWKYGREDIRGTPGYGMRVCKKCSASQLIRVHRSIKKMGQTEPVSSPSKTFYLYRDKLTGEIVREKR
jgi:hypothetical protein